ncbi:receptor-type tyrosine-protein phosphatase H-like [Myxocyprinus asiaticus]|uniref:receptor-type tyrosine-protein phosphatase H-like n=1 Tax=Myxocyprinus asiaticus TaxID=70543 RepID=UPI0022222CC7|nr:receptor-type tyrosine-protein phosphatase H-like [Myxocyprinus asiaticus]
MTIQARISLVRSQLIGQTTTAPTLSPSPNPPDVKSVTVNARSESELTLEWIKVNNNTDYFYKLKYNSESGHSGTDTPINGSATVDEVTHIVSNLSAGTQYFFTLYTVLNDRMSDGYNFSNVTVPSNVESVAVIARTEFELTLQWAKVNNNSNYTYVLKFSNGTDTGSQISRSETDAVETHTVSNLSAGTLYSFTLYTVFEGERSSGFNFSSVTVPSNVDSVSVVHCNDTDMILQWDIVTNRDNNTYTYILQYINESRNKNRTISPDENSVIILHISSLIPATNYSFTLYTLFENVTSNGYNFKNSTTLSEVTQVRVTDRSQKQLIIEWNKLNSNNIYNYTLNQNHGELIHFIGSEQGDVIRHEFSSLTPGTVYNFTLFTVVNNVKSSGYNFKSVTTTDCTSINWKVTNSSITAQVEGCTTVTAANSTDSEQNGTVKNNKVNLEDLYPGAKYTVLLWYDLDSEKLLQCTHNLTIVPNSVSHLRCGYFFGGYGLAVFWDPPFGVVEVVQVEVDGKIFNQSNSRQDVMGLQVAQLYTVNATSLSGDSRSDPVTVRCQTDPMGVIAGVLVFFLLLIIICVAVFIWFRRPKLTRGTKLPVESKKVANNKYKQIPLEKFPEHFQNMSRDENRGFSEEYEDLSSVGVEQSQCVALLPENKNKNRFSNVLAYDCSRVHLTIHDEGDSDYINANYMPGFGSANRQYIATQGPLPTTINDFWRMIWEKRSQVIVMVTNCIESGRTKCEQYWPLDYTPCLYGDLLVTVTSEEKARSWTLREFTVKNKNTSETRMLRHCHFTAWPDHGVPLSTEELIQFRELVRQRIESSSSAGPTVVHCSAGVGRTGTLIALDVLLQQLQTDKAVGIAAFVHRMRLSRPFMVQTETQYVFLHQCIMDTLQPKTEARYEKSDMIYANAMALKADEKGYLNN